MPILPGDWKRRWKASTIVIDVAALAGAATGAFRALAVKADPVVFVVGNMPVTANAVAMMTAGGGGEGRRRRDADAGWEEAG